MASPERCQAFVGGIQCPRASAGVGLTSHMREALGGGGRGGQGRQMGGFGQRGVSALPLRCSTAHPNNRQSSGSVRQKKPVGRAVEGGWDKGAVIASDHTSRAQHLTGTRSTGCRGRPVRARGAWEGAWPPQEVGGGWAELEDCDVRVPSDELQKAAEALGLEVLLLEPALLVQLAQETRIVSHRGHELLQASPHSLKHKGAYHWPVSFLSLLVLSFPLYRANPNYLRNPKFCVGCFEFYLSKILRQHLKQGEKFFFAIFFCGTHFCGAY